MVCFTQPYEQAIIRVMLSLGCAKIGKFSLNSRKIFTQLYEKAIIRVMLSLGCAKIGNFRSPLPREPINGVFYSTPTS